jgi:hypothetical protein
MTPDEIRRHLIATVAAGDGAGAERLARAEAWRRFGGTLARLAGRVWRGLRGRVAHLATRRKLARR